MWEPEGYESTPTWRTLAAFILCFVSGVVLLVVGQPLVSVFLFLMAAVALAYFLRRWYLSRGRGGPTDFL